MFLTLYQTQRHDHILQFVIASQRLDFLQNLSLELFQHLASIVEWFGMIGKIVDGMLLKVDWWGPLLEYIYEIQVKG